ncbi:MULTISPECIES: pilus assembly protein TadG-related protein [Inquilinus]|nr:pilus assembly protein TadG-related protein [Inquilinus ginsengisoli]
MKPRRNRAGLSHERGALSVYTALIMTLLLGTAAMATDVGLWYSKRRDLQSATDAAALAAAYKPSQAQVIAADLLSRNGFGADTPPTVSTGTYCDNASLAPDARYFTGVVTCPNAGYVATAPNAVRISTQTEAPLGLSRALLPDGGPYRTSVSATAARIDEAAFQAGTGLVNLNGGIANALLGSLLGTTINLSAVQYDGLVNTDIDALSFLDALATHVNLSALTYDQVLQSRAQIGDVLDATIDVLDRQPNLTAIAAQALGGLLSLKAAIVGNPDIHLGNLLDLGVWKNQPVGGTTSPTALQADLNLFQLVSFAAQLANGRNAVAIPQLGLNLGPVASISLVATAIEPPQKPFFSFGPVGVQVHTAQIRIQLLLKLLDTGLLGNGVRLPLYIEVAPGEATLARIDCGLEPAKDATVTVNAIPGVAAIYIGEVNSNAMTNFSQAPTVSDANIIDLSVLGLLQLVSLTGKAKIQIPSQGQPAAQPLTFYQPLSGEVTKHEPPTNEGIIGPTSGEGQRARAVSTGLLGGLGQSLYNGLDLHAKLLLNLIVIDLKQGNCGGLLGLVCWGNGQQRTSLLGILASVLGALDPLVDGVLKALGLQLGTMDVWVTGVRCGVPVLVQ